ncbi:MAG TPA: urease accessory protein UreD [Xanthobacteraceae bacterium]|nr:urease accessory protein UreD [Xanthobacteraceae bacterium]
MIASAPLATEIFAGNRAVGRIALSVSAAAGVSRRARVHEAGSLRVRFPNGERQGTLDAVLLNTAGGMTGGDRADIDVTVGAGARLTVTTAAAEKVYRSLGPDTEIAVKLAVGAGGALAWLPQETIVFDRVRLRRSIDVALARDANLLLAETVIFGRSAMGETVVSGHFRDRWRVRVDGALVFAETVRLDDKIAQRLAERAIAGGSVAAASVVKIPGDDQSVAAVRAMQDEFAGDVGVSAWNGLAVARLVAPDGAALRRDLIAVVTALGGHPLPRLWLN